MNPLIGMLAGQLGGPVMQQISQQIGSDEGTTQSAVGMALPMIMSAMGSHAETEEGAEAIHQATQEHDGSILDNVMGFVGNTGAGGVGGALLGQVMGGDSHNAIADTISEKTGMDNGAANQLLGILMPIVMSVLGKVGGGQDANGLAQLLGAGGGSNDMLGMAAKMMGGGGDDDNNPLGGFGNIIGKMF
jgi:hypothetical protein